MCIPFSSSDPKIKLSNLFENVDRRFPKKSKYVAQSDLLCNSIGPKKIGLPFSVKTLKDLNEVIVTHTLTKLKVLSQAKTVFPVKQNLSMCSCRNSNLQKSHQLQKNNFFFFCQQ